MKKYFLFLSFKIIFIILASSGFANEQTGRFAGKFYGESDVLAPINILKSDEDFNYSYYYQIKEDLSSHNINLLNFVKYDEKFPLPAIPYNRDVHFGGWLRDTTETSCLNTRGKVLLRYSVTDVTYAPNGCTIESGLWDDPYTAKKHISAKDIQIDHVVALKNAYMTGAYSWDFKKRCLYANYLGNEFHLLAVNGKENLKKSDHTPSGYIPPNKSYTCQFIKQWLNIKLIWSLRVTPKEALAINKIADENNCNPQNFVISTEELSEQRDFMLVHANLCDATSGSIESF